MTEVSPMPEAKPKSPLPGNYEEYDLQQDNVPPPPAVQATETDSHKLEWEPQFSGEIPNWNRSVGLHGYLTHELLQAVQGDGIERPTALAQPNNAQHGNENKGKDVSNSATKSLDNVKSEGEHNKIDENVIHAPSKPNQYKLTTDNAKPENIIRVPEIQKYQPEPPKPGFNLHQNTQNSFRPAENAFGKPAIAPGMQVRPLVNNTVSGQPLRKPDGSPSGYPQSYPNQPRQYQMPNVSYSSSSYQAPPQPHQTYPSPQLKGEISRPNFSYQNQTPMTAPTPMQRAFPQSQPYADLPQPRVMNPNSPRPHITQSVVNRPQIYQTNPTQRPLLENYQKPPNLQPVRAVYNPTISQPSPNPQYYNPIRMTPLPPNISSSPGLTSTLGESTSRYVTDASVIRTPRPLTNTTLDPRSNYVPTSLITDPNLNIKRNSGLDSMGAKKPENGEVKTNHLEPEKQENKSGKDECPLPEGEGISTNAKEKEEKEPGIVHTNVKYFEERDTAKVPLTPKLSSPIKPMPPSRSATFIAGNVVKGELYKEDEYESGVDVTPLSHPNLRNVPFDFSGGSRRSRDRCRKNRSAAPENVTNHSYPSTPVKFTPRLTKDSLYRSMSRSPSKSHKSIFELTPEEEFLYFFNIARASYKSFYDRSSRIDDMSRRKDNMPTANGDVHAPKKTPTRLPAPAKRSLSASSPTKTPMKSPGAPKSLPKTPDSPAPPAPLIKKVPMNKIQVGAAPSPNLKAVKSKIGSLANTTHKPGGGNIKIESHKIDFSKAQARIAAKNDTYTPGGGDKKIEQVKLQWSAKSKVGSLENAAHKPGGGDKKIESVKLDFKDKAKPKVGSKDNVKHVPGGGSVKNSVSPPEWNSMNIESQKLEFKAQSKIGSLDNVKHKPGGGDVKIFDDKTYLKQISCGSSEGRASGTQSYCDLSVVSEIHSISAPGTPHHGTAIKIKKSTTLGRTKEEIRKTTEVTVVSRSPSIERKNLVKSPSTHEVKLTYAKVASPKQKKSGLDVGPVEVVNVPASENAAILKPGDKPVEVKNLISNFEQITGNKGLLFNADGKNYPKTKPEPFPDPRIASQVNEELTQKFSSVKEELERKSQDRKTDEMGHKAGTRIDENTEEEEPISKFLRNEMAAHEKVGEIWKEVHNIGPDKSVPTKSEEMPPPPPPTPSAVQKPGFQPQQLQNPPQQPPNVRFAGPRNVLPQQNPRFPNQPLNMQRPAMQSPQRPQFPLTQPQIRSPVSPQGLRQPYPELGLGPLQGKPGSVPPRSSPGDASEYHPTSQQPPTPTASLPRTNINSSK